MKSRRLVLVSEHYQPSSGATAQLMRDLSVGLAELGWTITVLTATSARPIDDADKRLRVVRLGQQKQAADATKSVGGKTLAGIRFLCSCFLWCSFRAHQNDLVFIVSNPPFIGLIGPLLKVVRRLPYVFLFQDLFPRSAVLSGFFRPRIQHSDLDCLDAMDLPKFSSHGGAQSSHGPTAANRRAVIDCL